MLKYPSVGWSKIVDALLVECRTGFMVIKISVIGKYPHPKDV
jgi:hypothetical protein